MDKQTRDLTGQTFGQLTVIKYAGKTKRGSLMWDCICSCGNAKTVYGNGLKQGTKKCCGCMTSRRIDLIGKKFGKLTVTCFFDKNEHGEIRWKCSCDCGGEAIVFGNNLRRGQSNSCGCMSSRNFVGDRQRTHGLTSHPLYKIWKGIKSRCYVKSIPLYKYYGARGVAMCDEWLNNPEVFIKWALDNGWQKGLQIDKDKIAIEKGEIGLLYSPEYCSILTQKENMKYARKRCKKI